MRTCELILDTPISPAMLLAFVIEAVVGQQSAQIIVAIEIRLNDRY